MPTYDYHCASCGADFELFQSILAAPVKKCAKCGKNKARRLIGKGAGVIFKGSGFYQTDYRSNSYKSGASSEKSGASGSASSSTAASPSGSSSSSDAAGSSSSSSSGSSNTSSSGSSSKSASSDSGSSSKGGNGKK